MRDTSYTAFFKMIVWYGGIICLAGCSSSSRLAGYGSGFAGPDSTSIDDSLGIESETDSPEETVVEKIEQLFERGIQAADSMDFPLAHRLISNIPELLHDEDDPLADDSLISWYYRQIVQFYVNTMPPEYMDSTDEKVALLVFQQQLEFAFDSLAISPDDSLARIMIACQKSTVYDFPVDYHERVIIALRFFERRKKEGVNKWLQRAQYYIPVMQQLFADSGLPLDLAYLPLIESGFNPKAYSRAHASGIWQFIAPTGARYGLRKNFWVDERRDPIASTKAAISYLKKLYLLFDDWYLALAAYNCGENRVQRAIITQSTNDFWALNLPQETMNYVPKFIASLVVARNPECFGYSVPPVEPFLPETSSVNECLDLVTLEKGIAAETGTLERLNPHILQWCTPPDMNDIRIYLPAGARERFIELVDSLPENDKVKWYRYRIRAGDNLLAIAARFNLSVDAIKSINKLSSNRIIAGRYLFIPIPANLSVNTYAKETSGSHETPSSASLPHREGYQAIKYRIRKGETLSELADIFHVRIDDICRWNNITNRHNLRAGAVLDIYVKDEHSAKHVKMPGQKDSRARSERKEPQGKRREYVVQTGDNLSSIAGALAVNLNDLAEWNGKELAKPIIHPGEKLTYYIPHAGNGNNGTVSGAGNTDSGMIYYKVKTGENLTVISAMFSIKMDEILRENGLRKNSILRAGDILKIPRSAPGARHAASNGIRYYEVRHGDTLWSISRALGVPLNKLYAYNNLDENSLLMPGCSLKIVIPEEM